jgi:BirA family biotin operon repressor/biotin-[acetyl-CoA-carboxylase] ligase
MNGTIKLPDGYELKIFSSVGSTNQEAKRLAEQGAPDGTVILAEEQTEGHGRLERDWISPAGNLYVSVVLRNDGPPANIAQLSIVAAVAMGEAIAECLPAQAQLSYKWPNDILINKKKVCGLLLESGSGSGANWVVIGSGVNLIGHPSEVLYPAIDLKMVGADFTLEALLSNYLKHLQAWRGRWEQEGVAPVRTAWMARMSGLGDQVSIQLPNKAPLFGRFKELSPEGVLVLETEDGKTTEISSGDLFFT